MKRRSFVLKGLAALPLCVLRPENIQSARTDPDSLKIAYCGKDCSECPVHRATKTNDTMLKRKIASEWSVNLNIHLSPSNIACYGCRVKSGAHFCYCNSCRSAACKNETREEELCYYECRIRKCAERKNLSNCFNCDNFPCENHNGIKKSMFISKKWGSKA